MTRSVARVVALAAGGTGGHLFPAQALAEELLRRGYTIHLLTDERVVDYGRAFPAAATHRIPSASLSLAKPWMLPQGALSLLRGYRRARVTLARLAPRAVVGFGGYPSLPPMLAASGLGIPTAIHEQNAVMGRANRLLAKRVSAVASSFPSLANLPAEAKGKLCFTGNPVREIALARQAAPYRAPGMDEPFRLLVFGGSQGAQFFSRFMPEVVKVLPDAVRRGVTITQQCRDEDIAAVRAAYGQSDVGHELATFFDDLPARIAGAHLIVCRAGASTTAELGVIGPPAVLVPLPHAIDNDQLVNARGFADGGAGWVREQAGLQPGEFAAFLTKLRHSPEELATAARAALEQGQPDAARRLADLVESIAAMPKRKAA